LHRGPWDFLIRHRYAPGSRKTPWKEWKARNWVPGVDRRRPCWQRVGVALWLTYGSICVLGGGREAAGGGGRRHPAATIAGALAPARRLPGCVRGQNGELQQGQERVEGTTVGARDRWSLDSPRRSLLAPAGGSDRGDRASGHRPRRGGGGSPARRGASGPYRWSAPPPCCADEHRLGTAGATPRPLGARALEACGLGACGLGRVRVSGRGAGRRYGAAWARRGWPKCVTVPLFERVKLQKVE
jgi:hypothetical protein